MSPFIIPLFIPHQGCPHTCSFCNQRTLTGITCPMSVAEGERIIDEQLSWKRKTVEQAVEIAFYGGSFTGLPGEQQEKFLALAARYVTTGKVQGVRLSTRPDYLNDAVIERLRRYGVNTVEIGVQSLDATVLQLAQRGHAAEAAQEARLRLRASSIRCGFQLLLGLPGEDWKSWLKTVQETCRIRPDFIRIYPTIVLAGTELEKLYSKGEYRPLLLHEAVERAAYAKAIFQREGIPVIRIGLQDSSELRQVGRIVAGPFHAAFGEMVESHLFQQVLSDLCGQHERQFGLIRCLELGHHAKDVSQIRGNKNNNIQCLQKRYNIGKIIMYETKTPKGQLLAKIDDWRYVINKKNIK
ncbi:elongator complex protein 3 [Azotosporobacter soli]|uniref:elongator complex protein 3 n=1 Tax=Azotosporobacter soli TaxID=3055040 RepID=UPI0031FF04FC